MKKREPVLDFTSLLDVTLIIIFFFVLFSHLDDEENKNRTDAVIREYQAAMQEAEKRETEADGLKQQLEQELSVVREYSDKKADEISEILEFNKSGNLKLILDVDEADPTKWKLRAIRGASVHFMEGSPEIGTELIELLETLGYEQDVTMFCDLVFDGNAPGTLTAYKILSLNLNEVRKKYPHLYTSETDLSIGE